MDEFLKQFYVLFICTTLNFLSSFIKAFSPSATDTDNRCHALAPPRSRDNDWRANLRRGLKKPTTQRVVLCRWCVRSGLLLQRLNTGRFVWGECCLAWKPTVVTCLSSRRREMFRKFQWGADPELIANLEPAARPQWHHPLSELAAVWLSRRGCCHLVSFTCCVWTSPLQKKKSGTRRSSTSHTWIPSVQRSGWRKPSAVGTANTRPRKKSGVCSWCRPSRRTDRLATQTWGSPLCPRTPPGWRWWPRGTARSERKSGTSQTSTPLRLSSTMWAPTVPTTQ